MDSKSLSGKTGLVFGVATSHSIAWAIARAWHEAGARLAFTYQEKRLKENVKDLVETLDPGALLVPCDVSDDTQLDSVFKEVSKKMGRLDFLLHSLAYAPPEALQGKFLDTSRDAFRAAHDVSAYSLVAIARRAAPLMTAGGSILTLTYHGSTKVFPFYNVMGAAKASLEACVRYLAHDLGPKKIRVNAISAGPVNTIAARAIPGFPLMLKHCEERAPLRRNVEPSELGAAAVFLAGEGSSAVTGQVLYVDCGYEIMGI